jgi:hypothetical protein
MWGPEGAQLFEGSGELAVGTVADGGPSRERHGPGVVPARHVSAACGGNGGSDRSARSKPDRGPG